MLGSITSFRGRRGRLSYLMAQTLFFGLIYALVILSRLTSSADTAPVVVLGAALVLIWPQLAITAQRLHDIGASGWWQILNFVPVANFILLLVLLLAPGQDYDNRFGLRRPADEAGLPAAAA